MHRIGLVLALALAACSPEREVASGTVTDPETGEKSTYAVSQKGEDTVMRVKTDDGEAHIETGEGVRMPMGLPAYPGANSTGGMSVTATGEAGGGLNGMVAFETRDAPEKVIAFYRAAAARAGKKIENEMTMGDMRMIGSGSGDGAEGFQLMVRREGDLTRATLISGTQAQ